MPMYFFLGLVSQTTEIFGVLLHASLIIFSTSDWERRGCGRSSLPETAFTKFIKITFIFCAKFISIIIKLYGHRLQILKILHLIFYTLQLYYIPAVNIFLFIICHILSRHHFHLLRCFHTTAEGVHGNTGRELLLAHSGELSNALEVAIVASQLIRLLWLTSV